MSFAVKADAYDSFMGEWSRRLAPRLVEFAGVGPGQIVLDVGCGPGALTEVLVTMLGAGAVSAIDPSEPFVVAARARNPGVDVRQARAEELPFPDEMFDAALAQLVVHFMGDPTAGLAEMMRVVKNDGVVAGCVWDYAGGRGPLGPFWEVARDLDPDATDETQLAGTRQGHLGELLGSAGLRNVDEGVLTAVRSYEAFEEWWEPFTLGVGPAGAYFLGLRPSRQTLLRERCRSLLPEGRFRLTAHAWAARGVA